MAISSNAVQNNLSGSNQTNAPARSRTIRQGSSTISITEGQTLKGVVSDIHGDAITLSMEDGTSFTGKLADANQYSIGQQAAFKVTSLDANTIYMKAMNEAYLLDMDDTIAQALEEANLPKTSRNFEVVKSLLKNQQSISRENIMNSIRLCARFPEADVNSIITMKRLNMPMTDDSIKQFTNYQNQTHQLLYKMDSLTDSINELMVNVSTTEPESIKEATSKLINIALMGDPSFEELALKEADAKSLLGSNPIVDATGNPVVDANGNPVVDANGNPVVDANGNPIVDANSAQDATNQTKPLLDENGNQVLDKDGNPVFISENEQAEGAQGRLQKVFDFFNNRVFGTNEKINSSNQTTQFIHEQTGYFMDSEARSELTNSLSELGLSDELLQAAKNGTATARDLLAAIGDELKNLSNEQVAKLVQSKGFQALTKNQFMSDWTISPEALKENLEIDETYSKMYHTFKNLSDFSSQILGKENAANVTLAANDMSENLNFMKVLNETFQYIQLPLKLQNQNAHGDLYVMTRKESLKKNPNNLKVLLHLDMDNLGTLDVQISKENTSVSTKFFLSDEDVLALFKNNIDTLGDAINEQGYAFTNEVSLKEKNVDVVNDFIGADKPVGDFKRYNFDLRA